AMRWLARHRLLWEIVMTGSTMFTLAFEIGFPFLVWYRAMRGPMLIAGVFLHLGIAMGMGLVTFSLVMLTMLLSFVPPEAVHRWLERVGEAFPGGTRRPEQTGARPARARASQAVA